MTENFCWWECRAHIWKLQNMFIQYIQCFNFAIFFSQFRASLLWNFSRKFARLVLKHCIGLLPLFFFFSKIAYSDQKFCDWDLKLLQATQHQGTGRGCLETLISTRWCCCDHCYTLGYQIIVAPRVFIWGQELAKNG